MNKLGRTISSAIFPHSDIARPSVSVRVRAEAMSDMCTPLSVINITIYVIKLALATSLVISPATCDRQQSNVVDVLWHVKTTNSSYLLNNLSN